MRWHHENALAHTPVRKLRVHIPFVAGRPDLRVQRLPSPSSYTYTSTIAESSVAIQKALADSGVGSMSVALVDGDRVVWSQAFRNAATATGPVPTTGTLYAIGSVTKVITAVAVMKLVEQGKVKLDEPLVTYLPGFSMLSPEYRDITVRMLINHSSGFAGTDGRNGFRSAPFSGYAEQVQETLQGERLKHTPISWMPLLTIHWRGCSC